MAKPSEAARFSELLTHKKVSQPPSYNRNVTNPTKIMIHIIVYFRGVSTLRRGLVGGFKYGTGSPKVSLNAGGGEGGSADTAP